MNSKTIETVRDVDLINHAQDHMVAVLNILYGNGDINELESHLEEVCAVLSLNLPESELKVEKKT